MAQRIQVVLDGKVIGERRSAREYTHAVVADRIARRVEPYTEVRLEPCAPEPVVLSYHHTAELAHRQRERGSYSSTVTNVRVVATTVVAIARRERIRCEADAVHTWQDNSTPPVTFARVKRCLRDAVPGTHRCAEHQATDNLAVRAEADRIHAAGNAELGRRWTAAHAAQYTAETCRVIPGRCPVHPRPAEG